MSHADPEEACASKLSVQTLFHLTPSIKELTNAAEMALSNGLEQRCALKLVGTHARESGSFVFKGNWPQIGCDTQCSMALLSQAPFFFEALPLQEAEAPFRQCSCLTFDTVPAMRLQHMEHVRRHIVAKRYCATVLL